MKFVNGEEMVSGRTNNEVFLFDRRGDVIEGEDQYKVQHLAKKVIPDKEFANSNITFYIQTHQGTLFDPNGPYGRRERQLDLTLKRVSQNTFDMYVTYLKTNNSIYLTKAQRGFLND